MTITALPTPPLRSDPPDTFISKADAFMAALPTFVTETNSVATAMNLNATTDTSATSNAIGTGAKTFTVTAGKSFQPGMYLMIADTAAPSTNFMFCQVTSYSGTSLVVNSISIGGTGTKTAWTISQSALAINPALPKNSFYGFRLANNSIDVINDIDIQAGECRDGTDAYDISLSSTMTKQLNAAWAVGTGTGGLDTGAKAVSTWYHVWVIRKDSDGSADVLFSTSPSAPTMPSGYTAKRKIGAILTDSAGNIETFSQFGDVVQWKENMGLDVNTAVLGTSRTSYALGSVPTGYEVEAHFNMVCSSAGSEVVTVSNPDQLDAAPSQTAWPLSSASSRARDQGNKRCVTNTAAQIAARSTVASTTLIIATTGYRYLREVM